MDLQVYRNRITNQRDFLERRLETRDRNFHAATRKEEATADVFASEASGSCRLKEFDPRQNGHFEQISRGTKPNYTSLADIYEGALRKVLNLQLNLKIEEQPRFQDGNDVTHPNKTSPPRPTAIRMEDEHHREEYRHRRHKSEDESDSRIAPQGHNILRKLGERSTAEGSAFHVPTKRRILGFPSLERETEFPLEHFGLPRRRSGPEVPMEYGHSPYQSHLYGARMDHLRRARIAPSYAGPRGVVHESYSRYSSHQREIPPLFPVRCSSVELDGPTTTRNTEFEGRDYRSRNVTSLNGIRSSMSVLKYSNSKLNIAKIERDDNDKLQETFNKANDHLTHHKTSPTALRHSPERKSPHSERYRPYSRRNRPVSSPMNGSVEVKGENDYKTLETELQHEAKRSNGEEDEKEEFLSSLGLARIF
ncbi:hypothetical protein QZH41_008794 [Actinostola sp. cb2023]|nr:hypothetical protein QZH41_008794 [Actinostola sp. cb2023]